MFNHLGIAQGTFVCLLCVAAATPSASQSIKGHHLGETFTEYLANASESERDTVAQTEQNCAKYGSSESPEDAVLRVNKDYDPAALCREYRALRTGSPDPQSVDDYFTGDRENHTVKWITAVFRNGHAISLTFALYGPLDGYAADLKNKFGVSRTTARTVQNAFGAKWSLNGLRWTKPDMAISASEALDDELNRYTVVVLERPSEMKAVARSAPARKNRLD